MSKTRRTIRAEDVPASLLPKSLKKFSLFDLDPLEIARQITLIESNLLQKIQYCDLLHQEWNRKQSVLAKYVRAMSSLSTKVLYNVSIDYRVGNRKNS